MGQLVNTALILKDTGTIMSVNPTICKIQKTKYNVNNKVSIQSKFDESKECDVSLTPGGDARHVRGLNRLFTLTQRILWS